jgi:hypothetical protein
MPGHPPYLDVLLYIEAQLPRVFMHVVKLGDANEALTPAEAVDE